MADEPSGEESEGIVQISIWDDSNIGINGAEERNLQSASGDATQDEPLRAIQNPAVWSHSRPMITGDYLNLGKSPQPEEAQVPIPVPLPTPLLIGGLGLVGAILVRRQIQGR